MTTVPEYAEVFIKYFSEELSTPSLKKFHLANPEYIAAKSKSFTNVARTWRARFKKAAEDHGVKEYSIEEPDWNHILERIMERILKEKYDNQAPEIKARATTVSSSSTPSSNGNSLLTESQKQAFEEKYRSMDPKRMWEVEEGVFVEKKMYEYGLTVPYEHAVHSFILNISDPCWSKVFNPSQLTKIHNDYVKELPPVQQEMKTFHKNFKNMTDVEQLWNIAEEHRFHPIAKFDLDWSRRSILDILSSYRWGSVQRAAVSGGERDLIMLIWRAVDMCFQNLKVDSLRSDQQSAAGSARCNEGRVGADGSIKGKAQACKPDMILKKDQLEYGASEHGYADEAGVGAKEIEEKFLKLPKTLKDMALRLASAVNNDEEKIRLIRVVGMVNTHLRMNAMILDMPDGYVCRIRPLQEKRIAATLEEPFSKTYIPFLEQVIRIKGVVKETLDVVFGVNGESDGEDDDDGTGYVPSTPTIKTLIIPSAMNTPVGATSKKRKTSVS